MIYVTGDTHGARDFFQTLVPRVKQTHEKRLCNNLWRCRCDI